MATERLQVLREIFGTPEVSQHFADAPEPWIWSLLNSIVSAIPVPNIQLVPSTIVTVVTALFAVLNPGYLENHYKAPEFYATPRSDIRAQYDYVVGECAFIPLAESILGTTEIFDPRREAVSELFTL